MSELEKCLKKLDQIIDQINDINMVLAGKQLVSDVDKWMAVKSAEYIIKEGN